MLICRKFHKKMIGACRIKPLCMECKGICMRRVKGKQVQILYELVTVIRE